jgi:hypothetical protein
MFYQMVALVRVAMSLEVASRRAPIAENIQFGIAISLPFTNEGVHLDTVSI